MSGEGEASGVTSSSYAEEQGVIASQVTIESKPVKGRRIFRLRHKPSKLSKMVKILPHGTPRFVKTVLQHFRHHFKTYNNKFDPSRIMPVMLTDRALEIGSSSYRYVMFSEFCQSYETVLYQLLKFAQTVPGFEHVHNDDRMILIKTGLIDIWLILLSRRLFSVKSCITLEDNSIIPNSELSAIYSKDYTQELKRTVSKVNKLGMSLTERALFVCATLACPYRPNLIDSHKVADIQATYLQAIVTQSKLHKPRHSKDPEQLKVVLEAVYNVGKMHAEQMNSYRKSCERLTTVPPVMKELFDLNPPSLYKEKSEK